MTQIVEHLVPTIIFMPLQNDGNFQNEDERFMPTIHGTKVAYHKGRTLVGSPGGAKARDIACSIWPFGYDCCY